MTDGDAVVTVAPMSSSDESALRGLITQAMAYRVKYRKLDFQNLPIRIPIQIRNLGAHTKNRGGLYPAGVRCKNLCIEVLLAGFNQEEANHAGVCVEERSVEERSVGARAGGGQTFREFNVFHSRKSELLSSCFQEGYDDVTYGTLSHTHIMLVLRAWLTAAKWDIPPNEERGLVYCDAEGKLSLTAVADHENAKELVASCKDGLLMEVLSYKMDIEEPGAASIISQAHNKGQEAALATTELTAVAVLRGEIIRQRTTLEKAQEVAYQSVREKVREELDTYVDEPDFIDLFDFLVGVGAGQNSYIDGLLDFGSRFVDAKIRRLRLGAFAEAGKIDVRCPRVKIAVLKRAYRKKPTSGFCPSPESKWGKYEFGQLIYLEQLLQFFHVDCKEAILKKFDDKKQGVFLASVDVAAAEAFSQFPVMKASRDEMQLKIAPGLLEATLKYADQLVEHLPFHTAVADEMRWIDFGPLKAASISTQASSSANSKAATKEPVQARVVVFDEKTGQQTVSQKEFVGGEKAPTSKQAPIALPWRHWRESAMCKELGSDECDCAVALTVLNTLHSRYPTDEEEVDILFDGSKIYVVAAYTIKEAGHILLLPCVPKQSKLYKHAFATHPHRVMLTVHTRPSPARIDAAVTASIAEEAPTAVAADTSAAVTVETKTAIAEPKSKAGKKQWPSRRSIHRGPTSEKVAPRTSPLQLERPQSQPEMPQSREIQPLMEIPARRRSKEV